MVWPLKIAANFYLNPLSIPKAPWFPKKTSKKSQNLEFPKQKDETLELKHNKPHKQATWD